MPNMYPAEWHCQSPSRKRKHSTTATVEDAAPSPTSPLGQVPASPHPPAESAQKLELNIAKLILRKINVSGRAPATPPELNLDVVLSRIPYKSILENLFGRDEYVGRSVPVVTRIHEEYYMRQPMHGERPCAAGDLCECMTIDPTKPFIGAEFLLPNEDPGPNPHFCVLCSRKVTQKMFYDIIFCGSQCQGIIQRYANICNVPGEYARECMLICPRNGPLHCMPDPIMSHQRNRYEVYIANGIKHLRQINVYYEDHAFPVHGSSQPGGSAAPCIKQLQAGVRSPEPAHPPRREAPPSAAERMFSIKPRPPHQQGIPPILVAPVGIKQEPKGEPAAVVPEKKVKKEMVFKQEPKEEPAAVPERKVKFKQEPKEEPDPNDFAYHPTLAAFVAAGRTKLPPSIPKFKPKPLSPVAPKNAETDAIKRTTFIHNHPTLNAFVAELHCRLQRDESAQAQIDAHLPAAALQMSMVRGAGGSRSGGGSGSGSGRETSRSRINKTLDASYFVLLPEDTPQFRTLPDLGWLVRGCLIAQDPPALPYLTDMIAHMCLPYPRTASSSPSASHPPDATCCWVLLNLLLATLMGLYPANVKRAPFHARVWLYTRVHGLLTSTPPEQSLFVSTHPHLFQVALAEYLCHVLPMYLVAEHEALVAVLPPLRAFFLQGNTIADSFRQEAIDTGREPWEHISAHAQAVSEKLSRLYKAKCRSLSSSPRHLQLHPRSSSAAAAAAHLKRQGLKTREMAPHEIQAAMEAHVITRYPFHDNIQNALHSEYTALTDSDLHVEEIHGVVQVHKLSQQSRRMQELMVEDLEQRCCILGKMRRTMHVCLLCKRNRVNGVKKKKNIRLCSRTDRVVCLQHGAEAVAAIDTLGKIVCVQGVQHIFTGCCGTVQEYSGDGSDFTRPPFDDATGAIAKCKHQILAAPRLPSKASPRERPMCDFCAGPALQHRHVVLDLATAELAHVCLCQKHTPPHEWLRNATTRRQFELVVHSWVKRWSPRPELNASRRGQKRN